MVLKLIRSSSRNTDVCQTIFGVIVSFRRTKKEESAKHIHFMRMDRTHGREISAESQRTQEQACLRRERKVDHGAFFFV